MMNICILINTVCQQYLFTERTKLFVSKIMKEVGKHEYKNANFQKHSTFMKT